MESPRPSVLNGRSAIVTGGASGLGREIALGLARLGANVVVVGRDERRLQEVQRMIERTVGHPAVRPVLCPDLSDLGELRRLAHRLVEEAPSASLLVNNAGALHSARSVTPEGLERTFALNVLAPFYLTCVLAPMLSSNRPARVVNIASEAHRFQRLDLENLQLERGYRGFRAYGRSKLALILLTREFASRLRPLGISVIAVHPGFVRTHFGQNNPGFYRFGFRLASRLFGISVERGARGPLRAASDPALEGESGIYLSRGRPRPGSAASQDRLLGTRLFESCRRLTGLEPAVVLPAP